MTKITILHGNFLTVAGDSRSAKILNQSIVITTLPRCFWLSRCR